ncbi:MAG: T9SS type A sorting domain-containing protein [Bacteroidota bacterium]
MKRSILFLGIAILGILLLVPGATYAQKRSVTFLVNTATVPDTLNAVSNVVLTGAAGADTAGSAVLTNWGTGAALTNVGGDYWMETLQFNQGDTLAYKIRIRGDGWEENTDASNGNRNLIVPNNDTTLVVQFWNNGHFPSGKNPDAYALPYVPAATDTFVNVYVRVNLQGVSDNALYGWTAADVDSVGILGGGSHVSAPTSTLDWGTPLYLTRESAPTNSAAAFGIAPGGFYHGVIRIPKDSVTEGQDIAYKFRLGSNWSYGATQRSEQLADPPYGGGNRHFTIPVGKKDTTLQWVYFGNAKPTGRENADTVTFTWRVDMTTARNKGSFSIGDTVEVQSGWFNTADSTRTTILSRVGLTNIYTGSATMITSLNKMMDYQYYLHKNGQDIREVFYNFQYAGDVSSENERRQYAPLTSSVTVYDSVNSLTSGRRQPYWQNTRNLAHNMTVTWTVDMRPAYYQIWAGDTLRAGQGTATVIYADSIKPWGVAINGPATGGPNGPLATDWATWNAAIAADTSARKMWDDGTHGDKAAGDTVYSVIFHYTTANFVGQIFKFGIQGSDNEGGFGNNHVENMVDVDTTYTVASDWGSIDPNFYTAWDYDLHKPKTATGVVNAGGLPLVYTLAQNYPNPFNPSTKIEFAIPKQSVVDLKVYNILGQEVATLVHEVLGVGRHAFTFDAKNLASGLYFYRLTAGQFTSVKKMMLLK